MAGTLDRKAIWTVLDCQEEVDTGQFHVLGLPTVEPSRKSPQISLCVLAEFSELVNANLPFRENGSYF